MKDMHWSYDHLPPHLRAYSKPICELAREYARTLPQSAELNAGLRKLMEAKDCFVRAAIETHGTKSVDRMLVNDIRTRGFEATAADFLNKDFDPISNQPLPADSPYSMAHVPVTRQEPVTTYVPDYASGSVDEFCDGVLFCRHDMSCEVARMSAGSRVNTSPCDCGARERVTAMRDQTKTVLEAMKPDAARPFINSGVMVPVAAPNGTEAHRALCDFNMDRAPCNCDRGTSLYLASAAPTYDTEAKS